MTDWIGTAENIQEYVGFVYKITNIVTKMYYIGQKKYWFKRTLKPLKGKKRRRHVLAESDWGSYYGSSMDLLEDVERYGKENFRREIILNSKSKAEMNYVETYIQFQRNVLFDDLSYNKIVNCRISQNQLSKCNKVLLTSFLAKISSLHL